MKCPKCGAVNAQGSISCEKCGQKLQSATENNSTAQDVVMPSKNALETLKQKNIMLVGGIVLAVLLAILLLGAPLGKKYSNKFDNQGITYLANHNAKKAASCFSKAVLLGNVDAMNNLAKLYEKGNGVPHNLEKAIKLYEKAAKKGNAEAMNSLGALYYAGGKKDKDVCLKAEELWQKAADKNNIDAMMNLGHLYYDEGSPLLDYSKALKFFKKAAEKGNLDAMYYTGVIYVTGGHGVQVNKNEGLDWLGKAAGEGNEDAIMMHEAIVQGEMETSASAGGYSDDELCSMAMNYWKKHNPNSPSHPVVAIEESNGNQVSIHVYENMSDHTATLDWYYVDRQGKGTNFMEEPINLAK